MSAHRAPTSVTTKAAAPLFTLKKVGITVALLGTAAGIAGLGTFGSFTSTTSASRTDASGTVVVALGATGAVTNRLNVNSALLVPGDTVQRTVDLKNTGNQDFGSVTMTTAATASSLLNTDTTNGLQMLVERCSVPWTEAGTTPAFTYTCSGTTTTVVASRAVVGSALAMSNLSLVAGATNNLRVKLTFPTTADNTFQNLTSSFTYTFDATQRTATNG